MKQNLAVLTLTVVILINITGCSVVRFAETRMGEGLKPANRTKRNLDFQLGFATDNSLRVTLEYQPYSIYKPRITLTDLGVGLASLGLLGKVLYDNWDHDYTFTFVDDTFDWYDSEPWEKAVMIGVPADILLYWTFAYPFDRKAIRLPREPLIDHPYRIELPNHSNRGKDYWTTTGIEDIKIRDFLSEFENLSFLRDIESLKFRASTEANKKQYRRDHTVSGNIIQDIIRDIMQDENKPPPDERTVEINTEWIESRLRAGEKAILKITVKNTNQTVLREFSTITVSSNPHFDNWKLEFGNIEQGTSETRALGFSTDPSMSPQDVSVHLHFQAASNFTHPEIEKVLRIVK